MPILFVFPSLAIARWIQGGKLGLENQSLDNLSFSIAHRPPFGIPVSVSSPRAPFPRAVPAMAPGWNAPRGFVGVPGTQTLCSDGGTGAGAAPGAPSCHGAVPGGRTGRTPLSPPRPGPEPLGPPGPGTPARTPGMGRAGPARPRRPVASANQKIAPPLPANQRPLLGRLETGSGRGRARIGRARAAGQSREEVGTD